MQTFTPTYFDLWVITVESFLPAMKVILVAVAIVALVASAASLLFGRQILSGRFCKLQKKLGRNLRLGLTVMSSNGDTPSEAHLLEENLHRNLRVLGGVNVLPVGGYWHSLLAFIFERRINSTPEITARSVSADILAVCLIDELKGVEGDNKMFLLTIHFLYLGGVKGFVYRTAFEQDDLFCSGEIVTLIDREILDQVVKAMISTAKHLIRKQEDRREVLARFNN